jgi:hypothetical protein
VAEVLLAAQAVRVRPEAAQRVSSLTPVIRSTLRALSGPWYGGDVDFGALRLASSRSVNWSRSAFSVSADLLFYGRGNENGGTYSSHTGS